MRVLFTSTPGLGHFHPLLPLLRAARAAGDEVLVAMSPTGADAARAHGFAVVATPDPTPEASGALWSSLPQQEEPNTYVISQLFGGLRTRAALADTVAAVDAFRPDLVVSECMELAGQIAAERAGVPHLTVGIGSMALADFNPERLVEVIDQIRVEAGLDPAGVVPWRHRTRFVTAVPPVLWQDPADLPPGSVVVRHEDPEGPVTRQPRRREPGRRPRVYATLGSVAGGMPFAPAAYAAVVAGLGALDADVLFTVGQADVAALGPTPANVTLASYVAQRDAMDCDVVVSHAGSGTTVAALTRGLPMVAVPLFADQPHNAGRLAAARLGIAVDVASAPTALPAAVDRVLSDPSYVSNARRLASQLERLPTAADAMAVVRRAEAA